MLYFSKFEQAWSRAKKIAKKFGHSPAIVIYRELDVDNVKGYHLDSANPKDREEWTKVIQYYRSKKDLKYMLKSKAKELDRSDYIFGPTADDGIDDARWDPKDPRFQLPKILYYGGSPCFQLCVKSIPFADDVHDDGKGIRVVIFFEEGPRPLLSGEVMPLYSHVVRRHNPVQNLYPRVRLHHSVSSSIRSHSSCSTSSTFR